MHHLVAAGLDFTQAGWYRKVKLLPFSDVRRATRSEEIVTCNSGGVETRNVAQPGDYILKGSSETYGGDGYSMTAERFAELYEVDPETPGHYRHKLARRALLLLADASIATAWQAPQRIGAGGVVIMDGDTLHGVDKFSFIRNYGRIREPSDLNVFALLNESLDVQHAKAVAAIAPNHLHDILLRRANARLFV